MNLELLDHLQTYLTEHRNTRFQKVLSERTRHFTVVTEDVYQLHNTSAVMRTCDVFGIQDLHVVEEKVSKRIDKEIAMGAQKWVDFKRYHSIKECISNLKSSGYQIIATTPHENSTMLHEFDVSKKVLFLRKRDRWIERYGYECSRWFSENPNVWFHREFEYFGFCSNYFTKRSFKNEAKQCKLAAFRRRKI